MHKIDFKPKPVKRNKKIVDIDKMVNSATINDNHKHIIQYGAIQLCKREITRLYMGNCLEMLLTPMAAFHSSVNKAQLRKNISKTHLSSIIPHNKGT